MTSASAQKGRLRILYSFPGTLGAAGVGWTAWNQVNELVRAGHEVHLVAAKVAQPVAGLASTTLSLTLAALKIPHRVLGRIGSFRWHDRVTARAVRRLHPDLVHAWPGSVLGSVHIARELRIPVLRECPNTHTGHAYEVVAREYAKLGLTPPEGASHTRNDALLELEQQEWDAATALLVPSDAAAETFLRLGVPAARLLRHQYGCTLDRPVTRHDDAGRPFTATFLGGGTPRKGLHYALRAWQRSRAHEGGRFVVHGVLEPGYRDYLAHLVAQPGVELAGFTSDPIAALMDSDVLLLPSIEEGSALVTYEAQASGCVPLVSRAAGAVLTDGVEGLLHEVGDVDALASQLDRLSSDPSELARLRANALAHSADLTWEAAGARLVQAYREAIDTMSQSGSTIEPRDLSVVLCTRDRPEMLQDALAALQAHLPPDAEVIVVDSGSKEDSTRQVAMASGYRYLRSDVPGLSIARNVGLKASTRPIVVYTDDDCEAGPGWLDVLRRHFADSGVGAVTGALRHYGEPQRKEPVRRLRGSAKGLDAGHGAIMAFRRETLDSLGGFDDVLGAGRRLAGAEDLDMFCRVLDGGWSIVHDTQLEVVHMNTRNDADYARLMFGYGLGLGALGNKWLRRRVAAGVPLNAMIVKRAILRMARDRGDARSRRGARELMKGYLTGFREGARLSLSRLRFVDDAPPAPVLLPSGGAA